MKTGFKYDVLIALGLIGFGVSLYLSISHYMGFVVPCTVTHACETVLTSKYSEVLGLPVAVWGSVFFTLLIGGSVLANHFLTFRRLVSTLVTVGVLVSLILLCIQFFVLKKVCQYCFTVDTLTIVIFLWDLNTNLVWKNFTDGH